MSAVDLFTMLACTAGVFFCFAGSIGIWRFPDAFSRLHALTKADNLGLGLITLGALPQVTSFIDGIQLVLIWLAVMILGAVSCYILTSNFIAQIQGDKPLILTVFDTTAKQDDKANIASKNQENNRGSDHGP